MAKERIRPDFHPHRNNNVDIVHLGSSIGIKQLSKYLLTQEDAMKLSGFRNLASHVVCALTIILLFAGMLAAQGSKARIVRLSDVEGNNVMVDRDDSQGFDRAYLNEPIVEGMRLWTKDGSRAEIEF